MNSDWAQLAYLLAAGAVVLLGARWELRQVSWGPTVWRVMLALFALTVVGAAAVLIWSEVGPQPPVVVPRGGDSMVV